VFSFSYTYGDAPTALTELNNAVLTRSTALQLFGEADARGKTFNYFRQEFQVSAVIEDMPVNSHLQFNILFPFKNYVKVIKSIGGDADNSWGWSDFYTYVLLKPEADVKALESKLPAFAERHKGADMQAKGYTMQFYLQPLTDIHTRSAFDYEFEGSGNYTYLNYIGAASLFILLMAWLNYVNLSTSRSLERAKEVGVRKSIGAFRLELIKQFLLESLVVNTIAVALGLLIVWLAIP
jgi:putative ABC transport system permease protein